jgi:L-lactate dehydrogenase complex protein LldG
MNEARDTILRRIRTSLRRGPLNDTDSGALRARLASPQRNLMPARATSLNHAGQVDLFVAMAQAVHATVARVSGADAVPAAVTDYLAQHNLPSRMVMAPDPGLDDIPWQDRPLLEIRRGAAEDSDAVGLTGCFAAIAETGTLMLTSGAHGPTRNNFLPDTHIVVVRDGQVLPTYEEGWTRLRAASQAPDGTWAMPRTVNFVTGPSRTGDIEQRLVLGAHGPRRLHIIVVDGEEPLASASVEATAGTGAAPTNGPTGA